MNFIKDLLQKSNVIKNNKKLALMVIAGFMIIALIFISELKFDTDFSGKNEIKKEMSTEECIDGAGKTKVMITLSETTEYIYATNDKDTRKNNDASDDSATQNDYVIIEKDNNDTGLLIKTIEPKVRGVAIVCEGGNKSMVQNQIYSAISAVLNISTSRISISKLTTTEE